MRLVRDNWLCSKSVSPQVTSTVPLQSATEAGCAGSEAQ